MGSKLWVGISTTKGLSSDFTCLDATYRRRAFDTLPLSYSTTLGALLAQHDETWKERSIYYINKTLVGYELNYTSIEKACLEVVFSY